MSDKVSQRFDQPVRQVVAFECTAEELKERDRQHWHLGPPNPMYEREWVCSLDHGRASLLISAPGGVISRQAAQDVLNWLTIIETSLKRLALESQPVPAEIDK